MSQLKFYDCMVWGDMSSDRAGEQYPEGPVCEKCIQDEERRKEDSQIVSVGNLNTDPDAVCLLCETERDD